MKKTVYRDPSGQMKLLSVCLDKHFCRFYNAPVVCGRGGIGIRARLRGVSGNGYGFKSRRPHFRQGDSPAFSFVRRSIHEKRYIRNKRPAAASAAAGSSGDEGS